MDRLRVIQNLKKWSLTKIRNLWINSIDALSDKRRRHLHADARYCIEEIKKEWGRRRLQPLDPNDYFEWPSTAANGGDGSIDTRDWLREGVFKYMGYEVSANSDLSTQHRQGILSEIFSAPLPPVFPAEHLSEWGNPQSARRLQKMAEAIAAFTRNAKRRRDARMGTAIERWEQDLEYLYYQYYVEKFHFSWPSTATI